MSAYVHTEGILLERRMRNEADALCIFYTKNLGLIDVLAKGIRLSKAKLKYHIALFCKCRLFLASGREQWRLLDAERVSGIDGLKAFEWWSSYASFLRHVVGGSEQNRKLWRMLVGGRFINQDGGGSLAKLETIRYLGMMPDSREIKKFFSPRAVRYILESKDPSFLEHENEIKALEIGIEKILIANHTYTLSNHSYNMRYGDKY